MYRLATKCTTKKQSAPLGNIVNVFIDSG